MNLEAIRRSLEERLDQLTHRLSVIDSELRTPGSIDSEEQATQLENEEVLEKLSESEREELQAIRRALARIREGTYTLCSNCGREISGARLDALPTTTLCVKCADTGAPGF